MSLIALLAGLVAAVPQDVPALEPVAVPSWTMTAEADAIGHKAGFELQSPSGAYRFSVGGFGQISWPFGALDDQDAFVVGNVVLIPDHLRYGDLFDVGWGVALEGSIMLFNPEQGRRGPGGGAPGMGGGMTSGIYVSLQRADYEGDRVSEGPAFIDPDNMAMTIGFVGLKVVTDMGGGSFGAAHVGIGAVRYESVNANVALVGGGAEQQELFEDSQEFATEFRFRFTGRMGPIGLTGGLGFKIMGGPDEGDSGVGVLLDAHTLWTFDIDFGVELGF